MGGPMRPSHDYDVRIGPPERTVRFQEGKLFLGGLDETINTRDINDYCSQWGEVVDSVVMDAKNYGFVTFRDPACAMSFLEVRDHTIKGRRVDAKAAVPKHLGGNARLTRKLFVGGTKNLRTEEFVEHFAQFGTIEDAVIVHREGVSRGFGFVTFSDEISVEKCLVVSHLISGKKVELKRAIPKEEMEAAEAAAAAAKQAAAAAAAAQAAFAGGGYSPPGGAYFLPAASAPQMHHPGGAYGAAAMQMQFSPAAAAAALAGAAGSPPAGRGGGGGGGRRGGGGEGYGGHAAYGWAPAAYYPYPAAAGAYGYGPGPYGGYAVPMPYGYAPGWQQAAPPPQQQQQQQQGGGEQRSVAALRQAMGHMNVARDGGGRRGGAPQQGGHGAAGGGSGGGQGYAGGGGGGGGYAEAGEGYYQGDGGEGEGEGDDYGDDFVGDEAAPISSEELPDERPRDQRRGGGAAGGGGGGDGKQQQQHGGGGEAQQRACGLAAGDADEAAVA
ncbi:MAG: hypothetical protein J3K34DRAFT_520962 [Monoraphidium minutum]|nr:MAG: hypothetical protein J3K34DRAFT_520962 [Monoraphidium minutum]